MKGNHSIEMRWKQQLIAVNYIHTENSAPGRRMPQGVLTLVTIAKTQEKDFKIFSDLILVQKFRVKRALIVSIC